MGFSGQISIFGTVEHRQIPVFFEQMWIALGSPSLEIALSCKYYSWDRSDEVYDRFGPMGPPYKSVRKPSIAAINRLIRPQKRSVHVSTFRRVDLSEKIHSEVRELGESVVGDFHAGCIGFQLGPYDYCYDAMDDIEYIGSGNFGVIVSGSGSPWDWPAARKLIPQLPSVQRLAREVEQIIGSKVQVLASWSG
jgi:hypothetical protein